MSCISGPVSLLALPTIYYRTSLMIFLKLLFFNLTMIKVNIKIKCTEWLLVVRWKVNQDRVQSFTEVW
jgi:hypothetical protein